MQKLYDVLGYRRTRKLLQRIERDINEDSTWVNDECSVTQKIIASTSSDLREQICRSKGPPVASMVLDCRCRKRVYHKVNVSLLLHLHSHNPDCFQSCLWAWRHTKGYLSCKRRNLMTTAFIWCWILCSGPTCRSHTNLVHKEWILPIQGTSMNPIYIY